MSQPNLQNLLSKTFLILSAIGIVDAVLTAIEYTSKTPLTCTITSYLSCTPIRDSKYAYLDGIPLWLAGLVWFPLILALGLFLTKGGTWRLREDILLPLLLVGDLFTIYLWYLELVVIHAVCPYCLSLYIINYSLTGLTFYELLR